jgi:hypothetical protein
VAAEGTATVKLAAGGGTILKLKAADGTTDLNETYNAASAPDKNIFDIWDSEGDEITVASFAHIGKNYAVHYKGIVYKCLEAIPAQQQHGGSDLISEMQALRLEVHGVRETLPSVLVGHVLTPSQASRIPQVVSSVFDSLGLSLSPESTGVTYKLPDNCGDEWNFDWKWPKNAGGDDRGLERQSYGPVKDYLRKLDLFCVDVSEGQFCVDKLLFNADVYTRRNQNPMLVRGQTVYLRHRIQGRTALTLQC